jgi:hypothetical protein
MQSIRLAFMPSLQKGDQFSSAVATICTTRQKTDRMQLIEKISVRQLTGFPANDLIDEFHLRRLHEHAIGLP